MRRIVFWGNCQMQVLRGLHQRFVTPSTGDVVSWVNPYQTLSKTDHTAIAAADLIVGQVNNKQSLDELTALASSAPRHLVPTLAGSFLWPFAGQAHLKNRQRGPYAPDLGDGFLNRMIKQGVLVDEAVQRYVDLDVNAMVNLDRLLEVNIAGQQRRDAMTGYSFATVYLDRFRDEYLFLSPYHLNLSLARSWGIEIFERIGIEAAPIARLRQELTWAPFPQNAAPFHPAVIRHFGLRFLGDEPRYRFPEEASIVTFREFAKRYMQFEWNEWLDAGVALAETGKAEAALEQFRLGVEQAPGSVEGVRRLTDRLAQLRRHDEAIPILRRAIAIDPAEPYQHCRLAALLQAIGEPVEAETETRRAIELSPGIGVFHRRLSGMLMARGGTAEAAAEARTAVALDPQTPENFEHLGTVLTRMGQLEEAEVALRKAISLAPGRLSAHLGLSRALRLQRNFPAAIDAARVTLELSPQFAPAYRDLSDIFEDAGRMEEAEATLRSAIEVLPQAPGPYYWLARLLERLGRADEAIGMMRHAFAMNPTDIDARRHLSELLDRAGQADAAEAVLREAIATTIGPQVARLHNDLANLLERHGRLDAAIEVVRSAMAAGAPSVRGYARLSSLLMRVGRVEEAEAVVRQGLDLSPDIAELYHRMSVILERRGALDGALLSASRAVQVAPDVGVFHFRYSQVLAAHQQIEPAIEAARRAVALDPSNVTLLGHLGNRLVGSERFDEAEAVLAQALALAPDRQGIRQTLDRVRARRATPPTPAAPADLDAAPGPAQATSPASVPSGPDSVLRSAEPAPETSTVETAAEP